MRQYRRSRKYFRTARDAWADVARKTGKTAREVIETRHNRLAWVWVLR